MGKYKNEIEQFIYEICYRPIWEKVYTYILEHPLSLDLSYSRIKYPDSAALEDMMLEYPSNIRINEDTLLFDAVVSCSINLTENSYNGTKSHDLSQWLIVSCEAVIKECLESIAITKVSNYTQNRNKKTDGFAVSRNIVPIIYKKDLESEATSFLAKYYPQALDKPMAVPISEIAENLGLTIIQGHKITNDFSIFGQICFSSGKSELYDLFHCTQQEVDVKRGTIIIDVNTYWKRNIGCANNTIAHEVFHWHKHRIYAAIKNILRNEKFIACRCPSDMKYPSEKEEWTDEQIMEWQANNLAPRILMPINQFQSKTKELYARYDYENTPLKIAVLTCIADELAKFYSVSRQSALIRMIETGFKEASSVYQYDEKSKYHSYVSESDVFFEYSNNPDFRETIDSGLFKYVNGYFVINDSLYIEESPSSEYCLTDYAWANLSDCTLQFSWQSVKNNSHKHLPLEFLHRANATQDVSKYNPTHENDAIINRAAELKLNREKFERQNAARKMTSINKTCWQMIFEIIEEQNMSKVHFCNLTGLGEEVYRKAEKNINTKPSLRTIVAIARGLGLELDTTEILLKLAGHAFDESDEHQALKFCITTYSRRPVEEANDFLESYDYSPLGSKQLK